MLLGGDALPVCVLLLPWPLAAHRNSNAFRVRLQEKGHGLAGQAPMYFVSKKINVSKTTLKCSLVSPDDLLLRHDDPVSGGRVAAVCIDLKQVANVDLLKKLYTVISLLNVFVWPLI